MLQFVMANHVRRLARCRASQLAMHFFTSNTPPERVENVHLNKSFALLGSQK
jgi:hypothetical protein